MNTFEEIKTLLREKNGKKLIILSVVVFLLITAIVFYAAFNLCGAINLRQMNEFLGEIPKTIENLKEELRIRNLVFEEDILARAELGLKLYSEGNELPDGEKLERVRSAVSAASVSLVDGQGQLIATTGPATPEERFRACIQELEPRTPHLELYPALSEDGKETEVNDGKELVLLPLPGNAKRSLVFEFHDEMILELENALADMSGVLERMLSDDNVIAFAKTGDKLTGYPLDSFAPEQVSQLYDELEQIFESVDSSQTANKGNISKLITLLSSRYSATLAEYTQEEAAVMLTVPLIKVIRNGIFIATAISIIIGLGIVLFQVYVLRRLIRQKVGTDGTPVSFIEVCKATWPGLLTMLAVTVIFCAMLLSLESRSNALINATTRQEALEHEIDWRKDQESTIRSSFSDVYRERTQLLADFLMEHPDEQTQEGLKELNRIVKADYLMRFDSAGQELLSSNSYTGFSVGDNLSEEYRAVLLGYPSAVVGPAADPYTGQMQIGAAILMTNGDGQPDGFLLAVFNAKDLNAQLKQMGYIHTVNHFAVQKGHIAAAINEAGEFVAHTDPTMIGQKAEDYLDDFDPGVNYEGYTKYNGKDVCISSSVADGKTILTIVPEREGAYTQEISYPVILAVLLLLALAYYPISSMLIAREIKAAKEKIQAAGKVGKPMRVFTDGYSTFLTLFALFVLLAYANGWWTSFDYVFNGEWSKGVHLISLWAALFTLAVTFFAVFLIRTALSRLEGRLNLQGRTVARLMGSLISYIACFFLFFCILDMFGVNTTTLLASAGVISIAAGMGAQSMAADLLAGFFMMLEGSVRVGDYVHIDAAKGFRVEGYVTDMGIRTMEITDKEGNVMIINNSKANPVRNSSRNLPEEEPEQENEEEENEQD